MRVSSDSGISSVILWPAAWTGEAAGTQGRPGILGSVRRRAAPGVPAVRRRSKNLARLLNRRYPHLTPAKVTVRPKDGTKSSREVQQGTSNEMGPDPRRECSGKCP